MIGAARGRGGSGCGHAWGRPGGVPGARLGTVSSWAGAPRFTGPSRLRSGRRGRRRGVARSLFKSGRAAAPWLAVHICVTWLADTGLRAMRAHCPTYAATAPPRRPAARPSCSAVCRARALSGLGGARQPRAAGTPTARTFLVGRGAPGPAPLRRARPLRRRPAGPRTPVSRRGAPAAAPRAPRATHVSRAARPARGAAARRGSAAHGRRPHAGAPRPAPAARASPSPPAPAPPPPPPARRTRPHARPSPTPPTPKKPPRIERLARKQETYLKKLSACANRLFTSSQFTTFHQAFR